MKKLAPLLFVAFLALIPVATKAQSTAELQVQVQTLLAQIQQLQQQIAAATGGAVVPASPVSSAGCPFVGRSLKVGSSGSDVTRLQQFLARDPAIYPEAVVSGYYGALTEAAVKRWQVKYNIVSSGTAATTGFGVVGPRTAAAIALQCSGGGGGTPPPVGGFIQVTPVAGNVPLEVNVQATVNTTKSCAGATYTLDFGDSSPPQPIPVPPGNCVQMQQAYKHTYIYGGTYQIKLSAGGHQTSATVVVTGPAAPQKPVYPFTPGLPAETFAATPQTGASPLNVTFSGIVTSNNAGFCPGGCSAALDFGDGKSATISLPATIGGWLNYSVTHTYTTTGGYRATLYQGAPSTTQPIIGAATIVVTGTPGGGGGGGGYTYGPLSVTPNVGGNSLAISAQFDLPTSCTGFRLSWGDATTDQMQTDGGSSCAQTVASRTLQHTFAVPGSYVITLKRGPTLSQNDSASISISE
ncbi:MAG TPA: peptidoglycan-binding domain-containing protein [Candidatus Paceibacterota bacterium]